MPTLTQTHSGDYIIRSKIRGASSAHGTLMIRMRSFFSAIEATISMSAKGQ